VHEDGFGVDRTADNRIRFSRPDGRATEEHPQLPASGSVEGLLSGNWETGGAIDASSWIIPGDTLDYGIAGRENGSRVAARLAVDTRECRVGRSGWLERWAYNPLVVDLRGPVKSSRAFTPLGAPFS
jgi:hypothetical protein